MTYLAVAYAIAAVLIGGYCWYVWRALRRTR